MISITKTRYKSKSLSVFKISKYDYAIFHFSFNLCCHADIFIDNHMKDNKELLLKTIIIGNE